MWDIADEVPDLPVLTTFDGGTKDFGQGSVNRGWQTQLKDKMSAAGMPIYFMPAFHDIQAGPDFFGTFPVADGAVNWDAWAAPNSGASTKCPTEQDRLYMQSARNRGKEFAMVVSPIQFKHTNGNQNWYRRSELNFGERLSQIFDLQPDMVELVTWNDVGEGHNMGHFYNEAINFPGNENMLKYAEGMSSSQT